MYSFGETECEVVCHLCYLLGSIHYYIVLLVALYDS